MLSQPKMHLTYARDQTFHVMLVFTSPHLHCVACDFLPLRTLTIALRSQYFLRLPFLLLHLLPLGLLLYQAGFGDLMLFAQLVIANEQTNHDA